MNEIAGGIGRIGKSMDGLDGARRGDIPIRLVNCRDLSKSYDHDNARSGDRRKRRTEVN